MHIDLHCFTHSRSEKNYVIALLSHIGIFGATIEKNSSNHFKTHSNTTTYGDQRKTVRT